MIVTLRNALHVKKIIVKKSIIQKNELSRIDLSKRMGLDENRLGQRQVQSLIIQT